MTDTNRLLSEREAADYLGLAPRSLATRRYRRQPPSYVRVGRLVRYRASDLELFVIEHTVDPSNDKASPVAAGEAEEASI